MARKASSKKSKKEAVPTIDAAALGLRVAEASGRQGQAFHLFLGAGASVESKIKTTREMMAEFEKVLEGESRLAAIKKERWYRENSQKFARLFQAAYEKPLQRSNYVADCLRGGSPSSGYYHLATLINHDAAFRVTMTTNFDDLLATACITIDSRRRPLELWDKNLFSKLDVYEGYPIIVKLHGDYRDRNIKNTLTEISQTYSAFEPAFRTLIRGSGLVVAGYSGEDNVLTDLLLTQIHDPDSFPHGIFWCLYGDEAPSEHVRLIAERHPGRIQFVKTDGFDSLMLNIYQSVSAKRGGLPMSRTLSAGFTNWLASKVKEELAKPESTQAIDYAISYLRVTAPVDLTIVTRALQRAADLEDQTQVDEFIKLVLDCDAHFVGDPMISFDFAVALMWMKRFGDAAEVLKMGERAFTANPVHSFWNADRFLLNTCLVKQADGKPLSPSESSAVSILLDSKKVPERMGAAILLGKLPIAVECINSLLEKGDLKKDRTAIRKWYILYHLYAQHHTGLPHALQELLNTAFGPIQTSHGEQPNPTGVSPSQPQGKAAAPADPGNLSPKESGDCGEVHSLRLDPPPLKATPGKPPKGREADATQGE